MAPNKTLIIKLMIIRWLSSTEILCKRTPRMKLATRWSIGKAWHFSPYCRQISSFIWVRPRNSIDQCLSIRMSRLSKNVITIALLDDMAKIHNCQSVACVTNDRQVVADYHITQSVTFL